MVSEQPKRTVMPASTDFQRGLFELDLGTCCAWYCCGCLFIDEIADSIDESGSGYLGCSMCIPFLFCPIFLATYYRGALRNKLSITGSFYNDYRAARCCLPCTLAQLEYEVKYLTSIKFRVLILSNPLSRKLNRHPSKAMTQK